MKIVHELCLWLCFVHLGVEGTCRKMYLFFLANESKAQGRFPLEM